MEDYDVPEKKLNPIAAALAADKGESATGASQVKDYGIISSPFIVLVGAFQLLFIIFFFAIGDYGEATAGGPQTDTNLEIYGWFQDVHVMIFVGFGFLMSFLRKQAFTSLGMTLIISTFCIQWYNIISPIVGVTLLGQFDSTPNSLSIDFTLESLLFGDFCAAAVLITYGVVLGKVSPYQMMIITIFEVFFFVINEWIAVELGVTDIGGSMIVHMFGAYFGLALSWSLVETFDAGSDNNASVVNSDIFAMFGSLFLWMYWPSFNAVLGASNDKERAVVNTVISISASCVATFVASRKLREGGKFDMVDIQNATLAGGVAMGTGANMLLGPGAAALVGTCTGVVSVIGYIYISPWLEERLNITDTCGVNNLHGMPSLIGASVGIIGLAVVDANDYGDQWMFSDIDPNEGATAANNQGNYIVCTLFVSIVTGYITGKLTNILAPPAPKAAQFQDEPYWGVSPDYDTIA